MPLDARSMPRAHAPTSARPSVRGPFWRGAAGAIALAAWSVAGVLWAGLALLPVALEPGPRGRVGGALRVAPRRIAPDLPPAEAAPARASDAVPTARASGEAFPG